MSGLIIHADVSPWVDLIDGLTAFHRVTAGLERVLAEAFDLTQEDVHVDTGSLRGSATTMSSFSGTVWEGVLEYGGASPGFPNDPVDYAAFEEARGGAHDFLAVTLEMDDEFQDVMDGFLP